MPNKPKRVYWDACAFIALANAEDERVSHLEALMDAADKGEVEIHTSEISVVEVAFIAEEVSDETAKVPEDASERLDAFWTPPSPVRRSEINALVTREARRLIRAAKGSVKKLQAADAIHLATAKRLGVEEFHTYEETSRLTQWAELIGIPVLEPVADAPQFRLPTPPAATP